jgi:hypothetical protein
LPANANVDNIAENRIVTGVPSKWSKASSGALLPDRLILAINHSGEFQQPI